MEDSTHDMFPHKDLDCLIDKESCGRIPGGGGGLLNPKLGIDCETD